MLRSLSPAPVRAALALILCALAVLATAVPARAGVANAGLASAGGADPLAGLPWGNYSGPEDEVFPAYNASRGATRRLLATVALRPRMRWFGSWYPDQWIASTLHKYLGNVTGGDPNVLAQMAMFRVDPWEHAVCSRLPSAAQQASYRRWVDNAAGAIGSARVALVLQPDLPFEACVPHHSQVPMRLVAYAARVFNALPHVSVYIDAGAADWPTVGEAVSQLRAAGVRNARGFALDDTHYDPTESEIRFGAKVVRALAAAGIPGRHFVVNTSSNGRGFTFQQYNHPSDFDNARVCTSRTQRRCVTLGIPPTTDVTNPRWGLSRTARALAARYVDAFLWIGRPWLDNQSDPFDLQRTLSLARTTPF